MSKKVRITDFGNARYESEVGGDTLTVADVLHEHGVEAEGRRIAVNGHPASPSAPLVAGDELTIVPFVQGA